MAELVLSVIFAVLMLNLVLAVVSCAHRGQADSWLLVVLLAGTTGAAAAAVLAVLAQNPRFLDVAVVLTGTAALTAAVRASVRRRRTTGTAGAAGQQTGKNT